MIKKTMSKKIIVLSLLLCSFTQLTVAEEKFDINLASGTPLVEALRALSLRANKNMVINGSVEGEVSLNLENTTFKEALDCLAMVNGFTYLLRDKVVLISPANVMSKIETYRIKHLDLETLQKEIGTFVAANKISIDKEQSTLIVDGTTTQLAKIKDLLEKTDLAQKQINVKVTVLEVSRTKSRDLGLDYTFDSYSKGDQGINWAVSGKYEDDKNIGNILASPSITVFNGKKASVLIGDKVPIFTSTQSTSSSNTDGISLDRSITVDYKEVGVKLEVTPRLNDDVLQTVSVKIKPSVSSISGWYETENNKAPQISTREAETELRVKSGDTIYIGGLLKDSEIKQIKEIPFLSKLPILGELFKRHTTSREKTEIIIALTPQVVPEINGIPQFSTSMGNTKEVRERLKDVDKKYLTNSKELYKQFKTSLIENLPYEERSKVEAAEKKQRQLARKKADEAKVKARRDPDGR